MSQQNSLTSILNYSLPANNLLLLSLVKLEEQSFKPYVFMVTMAPGQQGQQGRGYDFNNRITLKVHIDKMMAFGHYLEGISKGLKYPQYSLISDPGKSQYGQGDMKSVSAVLQQNNKGQMVVTLFIKQGNNSKAINLHPCEGLSLAQTILKMCDLALEMDLKEQRQSPQPSNKPQTPQFNNPEVPQTNNSSPNNVVNSFADAASNLTNGNPFGGQQPDLPFN